MVGRRQFLRAGGAFALGAATATSGCVGVITGSAPLAFEAGPVSVSDAALSATGYAEFRTETVELRRTVEVAGQSREVVVTNYLAQYDRAVALPGGGRHRAALFAVLSTPAIEVLGREFNPVADLSASELAEQALSRYEGVGELRSVGSEEVAVLGTPTRVGVFEADAEVAAGVRTNVRIHVAEAVRAGGDFVVAVGAFPAALPDGGEDVRRLLEGVRHADAN